MVDVDVDAMLEAPFEENEKPKKKEGEEEESRESESKSKDKDKESKRDRERDRDKKKRKRSRSRSKEKDRKSSRSKSKDRKSKRRSRSRSPSRERRERERLRRRMRSPSPPVRGGWFRGGGGRSPPSFTRRGGWSPHRDVTAGGRRLPGPERRDVMPFTARKSPPRGCVVANTLEERDARTVFIMQVASRTRPRDLEEFFSSVGTVRDVRIITDSKTRRSKGICYVEFYELDSVPLALALNGQRLLGAPLLIQPSQAEKNRAAATGTVGGSLGFSTFPTNASGPMKLYVGSLHFNITEDMLRGIFEPFGRIDSIQLLKEPDTGRSRGYGFVTFHTPEDAKRAMEQLNGFELAGRPIKVGHVTEHQPQGAQRSLDADELDRSGIDLGTSGRLQLMAKLAEGTGLHLPNQAQQVLTASQQQAQMQSTPPIATQCFMLSNMFDPTTENEDEWDQDIKDDVIEECSKNGGVLHIYVDKESAQGNVYVKCPSVTSAVAAVNSLHGRWFAGKIITANYVPVNNYHQLFPDAMKHVQLLQPVFKHD